MRRLAVAVLVALVATGCEDRGPPTSAGSKGPPTRSTSRVASPTNLPPAGPSERRLPTLVLTANLDERPARWRLVAHIRFGPRREELGLYHDRQHTSTPIHPPSFAVDQDGTIWILDIVKRRIAHYSSHGRFLGRVVGVRFDRRTPLPVDIAFAGNRLYLLSHRTPVQGVLQSVSDAGVQPAVTVRMPGGHPAVVTALYPATGPDPLGQVEGRASRDPGVFGAGRSGVGELLGPRGEVRFLPGYPLAAGTFMYLSGVLTSDQDLELRYTAGPDRSVRPIHVRLQPADGTPFIPAIVQFEQDTGTPHGMVASVGVGPARTSDGGVGEGRWLLGVFDDGSPMIWERLPEASLVQEWATRTITATGDGTIYLMLTQPDGVAIYRRPSSR